jgi:hypothetical protein
MQDEMLRILALKLSGAHAALDNVVGKTEEKLSYLSFVRVWRGKYVLQREALLAVILELEQWQSRFDPSWYLIMLVANPVIDQQLATQKAAQEQEVLGNTRISGGSGANLNLSDGAQSPITRAINVRDTLRREPGPNEHIFYNLQGLQKTDITFSNASYVQRKGQWLIIERYTCQASRSLSDQNNDVRWLARKLANVDPFTFGLLECKGVAKVTDEQEQRILGFDFMFRMPERMEVIQSLRHNLLDGELHHSLSKRMLIAKELAKAVCYVHNLNFVHKHICPETILLLRDPEDVKMSTFLIGFDNFRAADGGTTFIGDSTWDRNLYRHPSRQGEFPEEKYKMQHDVYSLGVCLLEIGLWQPFVTYSSDDSNQKPRPQQGDAYQQFTNWLKSKEAVELPQRASSRVYQTTIAAKLKEYFVHLAKTKLPITMGDKYSVVVVTCLTCLDKDNEDFGNEDEMSDKSGILVAVRFIETILLKLNEINV